MAKRVGMVIDMNSCTNCMACVIACLRENAARQNTDSVILPEHSFLYARTKPIVADEKSTEVPPGTPLFIQCQHCENPPCAIVCPTGATYVDDMGIVRLDHKKCVACRACVIACPYAARTVYRGNLPGEPPNTEGLAPGYPDKCTFCVHRRKGDEIWTPACVEACAFGARIFGFLDEEPLASMIKEGRVVQLLPSMGTRPKLFFIMPFKARGGGKS